MDRKLVSIQVIKEINPIPDADKIEVAKLQSVSWQVVVRKNEFKIGDKCVYFEIDSLIPKATWNEFLFKKPEDTKYRLRTIKLRHQISQGLALPLNILPEGNYNEGDDVTAILSVEKWEPVIPAHLTGLIRGPFPSVCPKSDELRLQSFPDVLKEFNGREVYWTIKMDGTSSSFMNISDGDIHVCSRNLSLKESEGNTYWKIYKKYNLEEILKKAGNYSITGEIAGSGIQKNTAGLKDQELFVFNVYDIKNGRFFNFKDFVDFCNLYNLPTVPIVKTEIFNYTSVDKLVEYAKTAKYANGNQGEGFIIRPTTECYSDVLSGRLSIKVINNNYLLKNDE